MRASRVSIVLTAWLGFAWAAHGQLMPRPQVKKPVSEAVSKALDEFAVRCAPEKEKALLKQMTQATAAIHDAVKLTDEERKTLEDAAKPIVTAAVEAWKPKFSKTMAGWMGVSTEKRALQVISQWRPEQFGANSPVEGWSGPEDAPEWNDAVKRTLGETRFAAWKKVADAAALKRDEEIAAYLKTWVEKGRKPLDTDYAADVDQMVAALKLDTAKAEQLKRGAQAMLDKVAAAELERATKLFRSMSDEDRRNVMARNYYYVGFDATSTGDLQTVWAESVRGVMGDAKVQEWEAWRKDRTEREKEDMKKDVSALSANMKEAYSRVLTTDAMKIASSLSLPEDRTKALQKAADNAVDAFLKEWEVKLTEKLVKETPAFRRNVLSRQMGVEVDLPGAQNPKEIPAWVKAKETLISPAEREKLKGAAAAQAGRVIDCHAKLIVGELDQRVGFSSPQREKVQPLIAAILKERAKPDSSEDDDPQGNSIDMRSLVSEASKLKEADIKPLLEPVQWERWQQALKDFAIEDPFRGRRVGQGAAKSATTGKAPTTVESVLSKHLHKLQEDERQKRYSRMLVRVDEAARIGSLSSAALAKLETAAQGAVEMSLEPWIANTGDWMRAQLRSATPQSVAAQLEGMGTMTSGLRTQASDLELWKQTVADVLPQAARERWTKEQEARELYQARGIAETVLAEVNRRMPISVEQTAKLLPSITEIVRDYTDDLNSWYSPPWYAYGYIVCVPMAGVPEKTMKEVFSPEQLKQLKGAVLEQAEQYWTSVKQMHESRVKRQQ